jgi:DNA segregation ATPase FtsK/SpoIIIE, S-DNA-T family
MVMIFGYVLASLFGQGRNMLMMIPMMLSVVATITLAVYTNSKERKLREAAEDAYKRRISELRRKMESEHEQQRIYYFYNYPDSDTTLRISGDIDRAPEAQEEAIRSGTRLWERRPTDHDFLHLRLGTSTRQSTVIYKISENEKLPAR